MKRGERILYLPPRFEGFQGQRRQAFSSHPGRKPELFQLRKGPQLPGRKAYQNTCSGGAPWQGSSRSGGQQRKSAALTRYEFVSPGQRPKRPPLMEDGASTGGGSKSVGYRVSSALSADTDRMDVSLSDLSEGTQLHCEKQSRDTDAGRSRTTEKSLSDISLRRNYPDDLSANDVRSIHSPQVLSFSATEINPSGTSLDSLWPGNSICEGYRLKEAVSDYRGDQFCRMYQNGILGSQSSRPTDFRSQGGRQGGANDRRGKKIILNIPCCTLTELPVLRYTTPDRRKPPKQLIIPSHTDGTCSLCRLQQHSKERNSQCPPSTAGPETHQSPDDYTAGFVKGKSTSQGKKELGARVMQPHKWRAGRLVGYRRVKEMTAFL